MTDSCLTTAAFCICSALIAVLLRQYSREQSLLLSIAACTVVAGGTFSLLAPVLSDVRDIFTQAGVSESYLSLIFKAAAICFITQITCELCRDSGENAIASAAEMWGRGAVAFISLPLVKALISQISELLQRN